MKNQKEIKRPGDLKATGIRSTLRGNYSYSEIFEQLRKLKDEVEIKLRLEA